MLAFSPWHSAIEMKRYLERFMMYAPGLTHLAASCTPSTTSTTRSSSRSSSGFSAWASVQDEHGGAGPGDPRRGAPDRRHGMTVRDGAAFTSSPDPRRPRVLHQRLDDAERQPWRHQHGRRVRLHERPGCFCVWQKLADRDPKFGNPRPSSPTSTRRTGSRFSSPSKTAIDSSTTCSRRPATLRRAAVRSPSSTRAGRSASSSTATVLPGPARRRRRFWAYGQLSNVAGDYIKKPMRDCTGGEMLAEMLYHCGLRPTRSTALWPPRTSRRRTCPTSPASSCPARWPIDPR